MYRCGCACLHPDADRRAEQRSSCGKSPKRRSALPGAAGKYGRRRQSGRQWPHRIGIPDDPGLYRAMRPSVAGQLGQQCECKEFAQCIQYLQLQFFEFRRSGLQRGIQFGASGHCVLQPTDIHLLDRFGSHRADDGGGSRGRYLFVGTIARRSPWRPASETLSAAAEAGRAAADVDQWLPRRPDSVCDRSVVPAGV